MSDNNGKLPALAFTVAEFCKVHSISRWAFYELRKAGKGPRTMKVAGRHRISVESAAEWRRRMEAETEASA
jgi:hypothetical protein